MGNGQSKENSGRGWIATWSKSGRCLLLRAWFLLLFQFSNFAWVGEGDLSSEDSFTAPRKKKEGRNEFGFVKKGKHGETEREARRGAMDSEKRDLNL